MSPSEGYIGADVLGNVYTKKEVICALSVDHYKMASPEKTLVTGVCILTFAEKFFLYISVDIGM